MPTKSVYDHHELSAPAGHPILFQLTKRNFEHDNMVLPNETNSKDIMILI